jgi:hypothetical protein
MDSEQYQKKLCDAVIVCAGYASSDNVVLHTASKKDAQWLYAAVSDISETRNIDETDEQGLHREYYLDLAESDEHALGNTDEFEWNTRPVYRVSFIPTDFCHQRMLNWADENKSLKAPTDFKLTPMIAEMVYRAGAHEMKGQDGEVYIEFDAQDSQKLQADLQNEGIHTTNVGELWRMDADNSEKFREYAGIEHPRR